MYSNRSYRKKQNEIKWAFILIMPILLVIFLVQECQGQDKIEGVGIFKINTTTSEVVKQLANERRVNIKNLEKDIYDIKPDQIFQLIGNQASSLPLYSSVCPRTQVYLIASYEVAGIALKDVYLTFYDNLLVKFQCDGTRELTEALKTKYGDPKTKLEEAEIKCRYTYSGNEVINKETRIEHTWTNGEIRAWEYIAKIYGRDCKPLYVHTFKVSADSRENEADKCNRDARMSLKRQDDSLKRKSLKDF